MSSLFTKEEMLKMEEKKWQQEKVHVEKEQHQE